MSNLAYELGVFLGYFSLMIIFMTVAILTAKSRTAWIWYAIGAGIQLFALLGNQKVANINGTDTTLYWVIYLGLLLTTARIIDVRYKKSIAIKNTQETPQPVTAVIPKNTINTNSVSTSNIDSAAFLFCRKCGTRLLSDSVYCNKCGTKVEYSEKH